MNFDVYFVRDHFSTFVYYGSMSLALCFAGIIFGTMIGILICYMRSSPLKTLNGVAFTFVGIVRALPELVLIFWLYTCLPLITGVTFSALQTGIIALSVISGAYLSEIFRAGLNAVEIGQREAGYALGLTRVMALRLIIIPQSIRIMISPLLNFFCDLIKISTLLSVLNIAEMAFYASVLGSETYKYLEIYTIVGIIYFIIIFTVSTIGKLYVSRKEMAISV